MLYLYTMKTVGMRWIIPAVIVAISGLVIFQVNWLMREAKMKEQDEKRRIVEAIRIACFNLEKREAVGMIGNSLDSVFMRVERNDSSQTQFQEENNRHVIVINDSVVRRRYNDAPPPPPLPGNNEPPMPPVPPMPPELFQQQGDSGEVVVMRRTERMKSAVQDVMMQYIFQSGDPAERVQPQVIDSLLSASFAEKGIDYPYSISIHDRFKQTNADAVEDMKPDSAWLFTVPVFPGDPDPNRMQLSVQIDAHEKSVLTLILPQIIFAFLITAGMLLLFIMIYREAMKQKKIGEIRRDFINNMTHEFKTPLATMSLAADTIMNEKIIGDREKVKYYAEQIKNENRKLNQQVEKVLELSLTEKQGVTMHKEQVNLVELIMRAVNTMQIQVEAKGGSIILEGDTSELIISADPFHIERVFLNLIDNAMKYGGAPPLIRISIEHFRSGVTITFSDNGKGIPSAEWETIFEPFHRVSTGDIHNVKGFGLGLSYAKSVVKEHKGSLSVTKSSISGTTFTLVLMHG